MESYASHFNIEPSFEQVVKRAEFDSTIGFWTVQTQDSEYISRWIIVATAKMPSLRYRKFQGLIGLMGLLCIQVHILPKEMFGFSTFGVAMALLKWLPLGLVDKFLLLIANFTVGNTDRFAQNSISQELEGREWIVYSWLHKKTLTWHCIRVP
ncbi:hypothetical protein ACSBR1_037577 [Camellia fascicularis]